MSTIVTNISINDIIEDNKIYQIHDISAKSLNKIMSLYLEGYQEFASYAGFYIRYDDEVGNYYVSALDEYPDEILTATAVVVNASINYIIDAIIDAIADKVLAINKFADIEFPIVSRRSIIDAAGNKTTGIDVAGYYLVEIKENYKNVVETLGANDRLLFERGVTSFINKMSSKSEEGIKQAEAIIAEEKERTAEAINAGATADAAEDLQSATEYWKRKYDRHRRSRRFWFGWFVAVIIASILFIFAKIYLLPQPNLDADATPTEAIAVYLRNYFIPILAVAWVLRLLSRQFITQLLLEEDAELRHTLILTFLALKQNGSKEMAEKERAHMLEAIFRPLPVTPNTDVNQPTFADIAKMPR